MRRDRKAKIIATLGPATSNSDKIDELVEAGTDVFRLNFSHGSHEDHQNSLFYIRKLQRQRGRPIGILLDLQGPKLRVGQMADGEVILKSGAEFRLELSDGLGDDSWAPLPHPEVFAALKPGMALLLDDGKLSLEVVHCSETSAVTRVVFGGPLRDRKGVNVPGAVLPISPITPKDREDLAFGLDLGVDWVALSFVQRPEDIIEARGLIDDRAAIMAKIEKPAAVDCLDELVRLSDGVMVARGDLGVEMPPQEVPRRQKQIIQACRAAGTPVVVATQMLESMISAPAPTRAEASDVATAIYDGADAVMLSAETAVGDYPVEATHMMDRIIHSTENDPLYQSLVHASKSQHEPTKSDAISAASAQVAATLSATAIVCYTMSGSTALRAARERPEVPILVLTNKNDTAQRLTLLWGAHCVHTSDVTNTTEMVEKARRIAVEEGFAEGENTILVITAGVPFGTSGTTNMLRVAGLED
jgi:pyruvate kinase